MCRSSLDGNREIPRLASCGAPLWPASGRRGAVADDERTWEVTHPRLADTGFADRDLLPHQHFGPAGLVETDGLGHVAVPFKCRGYRAAVGKHTRAHESADGLILFPAHL